MDQLALNAWLSFHPEYAAYVTAAITIASIISTIMPGPKATGWTSKSWYAFAYRGVSWVALNFGHARNANDPVAIQAARDKLAASPDPVVAQAARDIINRAPIAPPG